MKKLLGLVAIASLLLLSASPSWALWDQYVSGEAGIIGPLERQEGEIHNYSAEGAMASDIVFVEAGIIGPVERETGEEVLLAECNEPFENFMGEAGTVAPVDRETC